MFASANTPKPVLDALHAAVIKALASPELQEKINKQTMVPAPQKSVAEAQKWLASEIEALGNDHRRSEGRGGAVDYFVFCNAAQMRSGVAGISSTVPFGSASIIALSSAGGAAVVPASPVPFTPSGFVLQAMAWCSTFIAGML